MSLLINYIRSLDDGQLSVMQKHFSGLAYKNGEGNKEKLLFEKIIERKDKEISDNELSLILYGNTKDARYRKLKSRLKKKIIETSCSEDFIENTGIVSYRDMLNIRLKKKLDQCRTLYSILDKHKKNMLSHILDEVIYLSEKEEIYDILLEALKLKRSLKLVERDNSAIQALHAQIRHAEGCNNAAEMATHCLFLISCSWKLGFSNRGEIQEQLESDIGKLR